MIPVPFLSSLLQSSKILFAFMTGIKYQNSYAESFQQ